MAFARGPSKLRKPREPLAEPALFDYAVAMLARRMRTERELRRLMQTRAEPGPAGLAAMDTVVRRLVELNYLSDTRFAADYTRLRKEGQKLGRRRVQQDLSAKGVAAGLVNTAVAAAYDGIDEAALARDYCARKRMKPPASDKETARTMGRLLRAGFSAAAVFKVLRQWGIPVEEFEVEDA
jgi:regulatory protein